MRDVPMELSREEFVSHMAQRRNDVARGLYKQFQEGRSLLQAPLKQ
jgi:hypothetical protein